MSSLPSRQRVSLAIAELMPSIIRGVQLDFFLGRQITQTQLLVLMAIHAGGRSCMGPLAKGMHVSMPTATRIVDRLVRAGYVRRYSHSEDRRHVMVEVTPKGAAFIGEFQAVMRRRWEDVLRSLNANELGAFLRILTKLRERLQEPAA